MDLCDKVIRVNIFRAKTFVHIFILIVCNIIWYQYFFNFTLYFRTVKKADLVLNYGWLIQIKAIG